MCGAAGCGAITHLCSTRRHSRRVSVPIATRALWRQSVSLGLLSASHAFLRDDCAACHTAGQRRATSVVCLVSRRQHRIAAASAYRVPRAGAHLHRVSCRVSGTRPNAQDDGLLGACQARSCAARPGSAGAGRYRCGADCERAVRDHHRAAAASHTVEHRHRRACLPCCP